MILVFFKKFSLRTSVVTTVVTWAILSALFNLEIYPLAPYTMYSYPFYKSYFQQLEIYFISNDGTKTKSIDVRITPWDESRLKVYITKMIGEQKKDQIVFTLNEILRRAPSNFSGILVEKLVWDSFTVDNFNTPKVNLVAEVHR